MYMTGPHVLDDPMKRGPEPLSEAAGGGDNNSNNEESQGNHEIRNTTTTANNNNNNNSSNNNSSSNINNNNSNINNNNNNSNNNNNEEGGMSDHELLRSIQLTVTGFIHNQDHSVFAQALRKASAWYQVCYQEAERHSNTYDTSRSSSSSSSSSSSNNRIKPFLSFPWVVSECLCAIKRMSATTSSL
jgi:hypothetical protein